MAIDWNHVANLLLAQASGYLAGSIPFGYLIARAAAGIDIRTKGSGNIGATNVGRVLGFRFFVLVFALDSLKGMIPVLLAQLAQHANQTADGTPKPLWYLPECAGFAAIVGHMFPLFLDFRGGKGVATAIGVLLPLATFPLLVGLVVWLALVGLTRLVAVGSIGLAMAFAIVYFQCAVDPWHGKHFATSLFVLTTAMLILVRHRANIGRIIAGKEHRIGYKNEAAPAPTSIDDGEGPNHVV